MWPRYVWDLYEIYKYYLLNILCLLQYCCFQSFIKAMLPSKIRVYKKEIIISVSQHLHTDDLDKWIDWVCRLEALRTNGESEERHVNMIPSLSGFEMKRVIFLGPYDFRDAESQNPVIKTEFTV